MGVPRIDANTIVVGMDGSPASWAALDWAAGEADGHPLIVCHVPPATVTAAAGAVGNLLDRATRYASTRPGTGPVFPLLAVGEPGDVLARLSAPALMLVLGAPSPHPAAGPAESTALAAVRWAGCPTVVVRPRTGSAADPVFRGHVVIGVDGSPAARAALDFGFTRAQAHHRPVAAVYVGADRCEYWYDERMLEMHPLGAPPALDLLEMETERCLIDHPGVPARSVVLAGAPAGGLRRASAGAALLVVGQGEPALAELGPTARRMVLDAACPVAVVPAPRLGAAVAVGTSGSEPHCPA